MHAPQLLSPGSAHTAYITSWTRIHRTLRSRSLVLAHEMTFHHHLTEHLARYKNDALQIPEKGLWKGEVERSHILPQALREHNVVPSIRASFWRYADEKGLRHQLHRDFHHLTSSQAFAFNLFFPVVTHQYATNVVLSLVGLAAQSVEWEFEAVVDPREGTTSTYSGSVRVVRNFTWK